MDYSTPDDEALEDLIFRLTAEIDEAEGQGMLGRRTQLLRDSRMALRGVRRFRKEYEEARQSLLDLMKEANH